MSRAFVLLLALGHGCAEPPIYEKPAPSDLVEGDPCKWSDAVCVDELDMLTCLDGQWTQQSCTEHCEAQGPGVSSLGCNVEFAMGVPDLLCECTPAADGCRPGQGRCDDAEMLGWCTDDWAWGTSSCAELCAEQSLISLGCDAIGDHAACLCTNVGLPCDGDTVVCANAAKLASCEAGIWTETDCNEWCGQPAACDPGLPHGPGCAC